jgi:hypothetical protein
VDRDDGEMEDDEHSGFRGFVDRSFVSTVSQHPSRDRACNARDLTPLQDFYLIATLPITSHNRSTFDFEELAAGTSRQSTIFTIVLVLKHDRYFNCYLSSLYFRLRETGC